MMYAVQNLRLVWMIYTFLSDGLSKQNMKGKQIKGGFGIYNKIDPQSHLQNCSSDYKVNIAKCCNSSSRDM